MNQLYNHLKTNKIKIISDHELSHWPIEQVEELKSKNHLKKAENSTRIYCDGCEENCPIDEYEIIEIPDKGIMAAFNCPEKDEMGFITTSLTRRRQWKFIKSKKRKRASKITVKETEHKEPPDMKRSCFVYSSSGIAFFCNEQLRKLPFRPGSHVLKVLPNLIRGSMTSKEIQEYAQSNDTPRSIVQNINRSILSRLHLAGFSHIDNTKFVYFHNDNKSYNIKPKIIPQEEYDKAIGNY